MKDELLHWYNFTYLYKNKFSTIEIGYKRNYITSKDIKDNKKHAGTGDKAVLLSCSYLGEMTGTQFLAE